MVKTTLSNAPCFSFQYALNGVQVAQDTRYDVPFCSVDAIPENDREIIGNAWSCKYMMNLSSHDGVFW